MGGKLTDEGGNYHSNTVFKNTAQRAANGLWVGLYTDTTEPGKDITLSTITEMPVANGYVRIQIMDADWTVDSEGLAVNIQKIFIASGADWPPFYGYFYCHVASGTGDILTFVEHITIGPITVLDGLDFKLTPTLTPSFIP